MIGLHEIALTLMPLLLLSHIAGALWHKVVRRDGILESMTGRLPV
jgi:cytochrome b561